MRRALAFLTPFGGAVTPSPAALAWFPPVGAVIGLGVGGIWWLAGRAWPAAAAAAVALAADVALTGYLHLDGLADAADGLCPPLEPDRRLAVMADPSVGAFGVVTVGVILLLRFGALASTRATPLVIGALWCGSRTAMAVIARTLPYARPGGLADAFVGTQGAADETGRVAQRSPVVPALVGLALAVCLAFAGRRAHGLAALAAEAVAVGAVVLLARRRIGGFTGDVLGAAGIIGETAGLLVLAAKW
ncbi:MAG: adenosylcobinamide-GDP ribazoletransferase [Acidimicrobiales bacterium]